MASVAERIARTISDNTKSGMAAAKARGVKLGGFRAGNKFTVKARRAAVKAAQARADARAESVTCAYHPRATGAARNVTAGHCS
jgi:DNA invertase Pin-like site-specific DNA recombinase